MHERFQSAIGELPLPAAPLLVGISGGRDSMCLGTLLLRSGIRLGVAHCHFALRGAESDADEALVRRWAEEHALPLHVRRFETQRHARERGISVEMAARELRYTWFDRLCREEGYGALAVAHHADDNAETLLLHLLRGTGSRGLSGMKAVSRIPVKGSETPLLRPLLPFTRAEIDAFVAAEGIPFREDASNADPSFRRNRLRTEVFPILKKINPSFVETLCADAAHLAQVDAIADDWCAVHAPTVWDGTTLDTAALTALPHWRYLLWRILSEVGVKGAVIEEIAQFLAAGTPLTGKQFPAGEHILAGSAASLQFIHPDELVKKSSLTVPSVGSYVLDGVAFSVAVEPWRAGADAVQPVGTLIADAAALPFPFQVRHWADGDWMQPLGAPGRRKLSDLFKDMKWSRAEKAAALVIARDAHVQAVIGHRIDEALKVTSATRQVLRLRVLGRYSHAF